MTHIHEDQELALPWTIPVDQPEELTFGHILPLLRYSWLGRDAFDQCLSVHWPTLESLVIAATATVGGSWRDAVYAPEDLAAGATCRVLRCATSNEGLALEAPDWSASAATWLFVVFKNAIRDELRAIARQLEGRLNVAPDALDTQAAPCRVLEACEAHEQLVQRVEHALANLDGRLRLAWLLLHQPDLVDLGTLEGAVGGPDRSRDRQGPLRPPLRTLELLDRWRERFRDAPRCGASRLELAWILRSEDELGPREWQRDHPDEARRGRDLLRQWHGRAERKLDALRTAA